MRDAYKKPEAIIYRYVNDTIITGSEKAGAASIFGLPSERVTASMDPQETTLSCQNSSQ